MVVAATVLAAVAAPAMAPAALAAAVMVLAVSGGGDDGGGGDSDGGCGDAAQYTAGVLSNSPLISCTTLFASPNRCSPGRRTDSDGHSDRRPKCYRRDRQCSWCLSPADTPDLRQHAPRHARRVETRRGPTPPFHSCRRSQQARAHKTRHRLGRTVRFSFAKQDTAHPHLARLVRREAYRHVLSRPPFDGLLCEPAN